AIEQKEKSVAAGLSEQFARLAFEFRIKKHRRLDGVPIMNVMRRNLEIPHEFSRVRIQRNDAARVEIVARSRFAGQDRVGISNSPIKKIQRWVVGASHPSHSATEEDRIGVFRPSFGTGLTGLWLGVPSPLNRAGFGIN